jgi:hypothetical protein
MGVSGGYCRYVKVSLAAFVALALLPASAGAVTFGADLNALPAQNAPNTTCAAPPPDAIFGAGSPSCMWSYIGNGTNSLVAPAGGVVNSVRVKVGPTTGKMRVNVIRFLFRQTGDNAHPFTAGPFLEAYGPEFTPAANAVTSVPTNLSMKEDSTPAPNDLQTIQVIDALALEVEESTVPFPFFTGAGLLTYPVYPGPTSQGVQAPSPNGLPTFLTYGRGVLMQADLTPDTPVPAGGGNIPPSGLPQVLPAAPAAPALSPVLPTVRLGQTSVPVRDGAVTLPIVCQAVDCSGLVTLLSGGARAAAAKKPKTLGTARFTAKAGKTVRAKVRLNKAGKALVKRKKKTKVTARVTFTSGGGKPATFPLTLKRG